MRFLPEDKEEKAWVIAVAIIGIIIGFSLSLFLILYYPNIIGYYFFRGEEKTYYFTLYFIIYSTVYLISGLIIGLFPNFESRRVLMIFIKGVSLLLLFQFLLLFLSIFTVGFFDIEALLLLLIFGIFYSFGGYFGAYIRQKYF